jgi:hypothetical protein
MTKIPKEVVELLRIKEPLDTVVYLTTSDLSGKTNVSVQFLTDVVDDEYVLIPDLFAQKTKVNLNENLRGVVSIGWPDEGRAWFIEGPANVFQWGHPPNYRFQGLRAGDVLDGWGDWESRESFDALPEEVRPQVIAQRGVIVVKAERVWRQED